MLNKTPDLLKHEAILRILEQEYAWDGGDIFIHSSLASTNEFLLKTLPVNANPQLCLAEHQTAGRGRRGRQWASPFAENIYLSIGYRSYVDKERLGLLSLAVGIAVAGMLNEMIDGSVSVKWPNDIYCNQQKLAGILIEVKEFKPEYVDLIIGVGLNVNMTRGEVIDQPWTSLNKLGKTIPDRSTLAARMAGNIVNELDSLTSASNADFLKKWQSYDYLFNKPVQTQGAEEIAGIANGINERGELLVKTPEKLHTVHSGEVSVRLKRDL
ncbi:MAG: biotin--[acetyl-CoA-carboxylase] ligase [Gammaproteobacteria bacterium]|nr:biotin--[acetyl-CoA-carboxylase] ligase [Gammaproteobacteria bacterium]